MTARFKTVIVMVALVGCGGGASSGGSGGVTATGGTTATGGAENTGGATSTGGAVSSGGTVSTGGAVSSGGTVSSGGAVSSGGKTGTGGAVGTGGATTTGGRAGTAGKGGAGGPPNMGGVSGRGGAGGQSAGGKPGAGGQQGAGGQPGAGGQQGAGGLTGWTLAWSDEFDGPADQSPDATKWAYDIGNGSGGWGNNELEYYTNRPTNVATDGTGNLVITLRAESYMNKDYTSARIKTLGKFSTTYGRIEGRMKIPRGQGVWPAFWMLGADIDTNAWPNCGEIDIMENNGKELAVNHGSLHGPGYSGGSPLTGTYKLPSGALGDDFHIYAVEWEANVVRFYVDSTVYETRKNTDVPSGAKWVYDHPFFILLNVAIGGAFPGNPNSTTMLPQTLTVDYVRVYAR